MRLGVIFPALSLLAFGCQDSVSPLETGLLPVECGTTRGPDGGCVEAPGDAGGSSDAGVCSQCPAGSRCTELEGCSNVCQPCAVGGECPSDYCRPVGEGGAGYCARRLAPCAENRNLEEVRIELGFESCAPGKECRVTVSYRPPEDILDVELVSANLDASISSKAWRQAAAGIQGSWSQTSPLCFTAASFSVLDACLTHSPWLRVAAFGDGTAAHFDYNLGGGIQAPEPLEAALVSTVRLGLSIVEDAGFTLRP